MGGEISERIVCPLIGLPSDLVSEYVPLWLDVLISEPNKFVFKDSKIIGVLQ